MHGEEPSRMTSLALAVPLTVLSVFGLLLNVYILFVVLVTKEVQTANNLLLLHLGAVDALLCATFLVFSAPEMLKGWAWPAPGTPCDLHGFLFTLLHPVALWTVCGLNCDRYYAITSPLRYGSLVNPKKVMIGLGFAWFVSIILCIPPLFLVAPYRFHPGLGGCAPDFGQNAGAIWYSLAYTTLTLVLPGALILGSNLRVLTIARYHRHRIASAIFEVTISAQVTITHQRNPFFLQTGNLFRGRSAFSTVLQLIGSFFVLYLPYYGVILWESSSSVFLGEWKASSTRFHPLLVTLASTLINCSPPVNGLLYGVKSKMLRKSFQNYWRKKMSKNEMNQEIQARTPSACGSRRPSLGHGGVLCRPASSQLERRSSEAGSDGASRNRAELCWRPRSTSGIDSDVSLKKTISGIRKHSSCNVLGEHRADQNHFGCRVFKSAMKKPGEGSKPRSDGEGALRKARRSPRILITRAMSEDGDRSSAEAPPVVSFRRFSSSTTALENGRWTQPEDPTSGRAAEASSESSPESSRSDGRGLLAWPARRSTRRSSESVLARSFSDLSRRTEIQL